METQAQVETTSAAQYLGSLCQYFGHKAPVQRVGRIGRIELPFGYCNLEANESALTLKATAATVEDLDRTVEVITNHLERFAFRDNPEINWHPYDDTAVQARLG